MQRPDTAGRCSRQPVSIPAQFDRSYRARGSYFGTGPSGWLVRFLRRQPAAGRRILDMGCGYGRNALHLARLGFDVTAVDVSAAAIRQLSCRAAAEGLSVRAIQADLACYRLPRSTYDAVTAITVLGHIERHLLPVLIERTVTALKLGGLLFVEDFSVRDPGCSGLGPASEFAPFVKTYLSVAELGSLFRPLKAVRRYEVSVTDTTHGQRHNHCILRFVGRKQ